MKKILKSKIFLCIIVGISCIGIGVYGASKYNASDVLYNPSNGEATNVNDALNELYEKANSSGCKTLCGEVKVGDYVKMTPTSTSYTISKDLTGYGSNQTINPSELNIWRVIKINENGTIEMVSEHASSTKVYFKGQTGYLNFVGALNEIANQYENSKYVVGSRIMGYGGQTEYITDTSKFTTTAPWKSSTIDNSNEKLGGGDIMYEADTNLVNEVLGTLIATNLSGTLTITYWLGSRYYSYSSSTNYGCFGRLVTSNGNIDTMNLYSRDSSGWSGGGGFGSIRPILTLKSGLIATGSGTSEDPWVLE